MRFLSTNLEISKFSPSFHDISTRCRLKPHKPSTKLTMYPKGVCYSRVQTSSYYCRISHKQEMFLIQLKKYLIDNAFYYIEEYLNI